MTRSFFWIPAHLRARGTGAPRFSPAAMLDAALDVVINGPQPTLWHWRDR